MYGFKFYYTLFFVKYHHCLAAFTGEAIAQGTHSKDHREQAKQLCFHPFASVYRLLTHVHTYKPYG
eukprot:8613854-Ditylum_brightwellii.AAC.1